MPAKNIVKTFIPGNYYHVYNRGVAKLPIFLDQADKRYFLKLLDRHLNPDNKSLDQNNQPYKKFHDDIELLCYCLMKNHFHLLIHLGGGVTAISEFMRCIGTSYTMYFNLKYRRVGPLFQGVYKASCISDDSYLLHITRYIHLNPRRYKTYKYSSLIAYLGCKPAPWLKPQRMLDLFEGDDYLTFLEDYEDHKAMLSEIKHELADK
jgi:putative transposase